MLDDNDVLKVAKLSRLNINDNEIEKYKNELNLILTEVNKINDMDLDLTDIMISPSNNKDMYFEDTSGEMISIEDVKKNASNVKGNFCEVVRVVND